MYALPHKRYDCASVVLTVRQTIFDAVTHATPGCAIRATRPDEPSHSDPTPAPGDTPAATLGRPPITPLAPGGG
ncbi:hypothetical protein GCM10010495_58360 [Kitasatospora herbaricolor]|nr:hypothetical protein GCM10010495_58360 [Kitasatospora herbaricolor]